jgi:hypothetical protein
MDSHATKVAGLQRIKGRLLVNAHVANECDYVRARFHRCERVLIDQPSGCRAVVSEGQCDHISLSVHISVVAAPPVEWRRRNRCIRCLWVASYDTLEGWGSKRAQLRADPTVPDDAQRHHRQRAVLTELRIVRAAILCPIRPRTASHLSIGPSELEDKLQRCRERPLSHYPATVRQPGRTATAEGHVGWKWSWLAGRLVYQWTGIAKRLVEP